MKIRLPEGSYTLLADPLPIRKPKAPFNRVAFTAAHVVADPFTASDPSGPPAIDWKTTLAYRRFSADGTEYSFDAPELELGWQSALPAELVLTAGVRYAYRHYRHPTTYAPLGAERNEHDWRTELALRRPIWRRLSLETRWRYQRNRSNVGVFDYTRHVAGLYASWILDP